MESTILATREKFKGGVLSDNEIKKSIENGEIKIENFNDTQLNPASYNLRLSNELLVYDDYILDMKKKNNTHQIIIPEEGYILEPGKLYLGSTEEYTECSDRFIPIMDGRSSIGRLGLVIHVCAGQGDPGFKGKWTLEIKASQPIKIYPHVEICQLVYYTIYGDVNRSYTKTGKYFNYSHPVESKMQTDIEKSLENYHKYYK